MFKQNHEIKIHFIGIGGIGMSGIAEVLLSQKYSVTGSDTNTSNNTEKLEQLGARIFIGHSSSNVIGATVVVYSSAIKNDNEEIVYARQNEIPIMKRAEMISEIMKMKHGVAVAGTHGKTTTTSFLATIFQETGNRPTYIIGGIVHNLKGHAKLGLGEILIVEADESDGSFLSFNPISSIITNIDKDHMEFYKTEERLVESFLEFANKIPFYGVLAINANDDKLMGLKNRFKRPHVTFGIEDRKEFIDSKIDYLATELSVKDTHSTFKLLFHGCEVGNVQLSIPGKHNVENALGAISMAHQMGLSFEEITKAIVKCEGIGRRIQTLYKNNNLKIIDDYAHHPTAIKTVLKSIRASHKNKVIAIFEPHRFTRTRDCWNDFYDCFSEIDKVYIAPIYPASEDPIEGIDSDSLANDINKIRPNLVTVINSVRELPELINKYKNESVTVVTLGAVSIGKAVGEYVLGLK